MPGTRENPNAVDRNNINIEGATLARGTELLNEALAAAKKWSVAVWTGGKEFKSAF
jgi:hypothetical protein